MIKTKLIKNIVLIGLMGSGKTIISKSLSKKLKADRFSIDEMIETKEKSSINKIVEKKGWPYFRLAEHRIVKKLSRKRSIVIDCGGGIVLNPANIELLKKNGIIFYLKASPQVIYKRLKGDKTRPLLNDPNPLARLKSIYKERLPLYSQADFIIDASDPSIEGPVAEILKKVLL
jgi:shikimate kinase